jgi:hypothetical protein
MNRAFIFYLGKRNRLVVVFVFSEQCLVTAYPDRNMRHQSNIVSKLSPRVLL